MLDPSFPREGACSHVPYGGSVYLCLSSQITNLNWLLQCATDVSTNFHQVSKKEKGSSELSSVQTVEMPRSSSHACQRTSPIREPPTRAPSPGWEIRREMCPSRCEILCYFSPGVFLPARASSRTYLAKCLNEHRSVGLALGPI